jgi:UDP-glucose 4-epimerase
MIKQKILITGSAGFIGSHLYDYIFKHYGNKYKVYGVDDLSGGFMRNVSQPKYFTKLDLRDRHQTLDYIAQLKPIMIFHLAADATEGRSQFTPLSALDRNLIAYMNVLIPAIKYGLKKTILVSSMSVYGKQQVPFRESMIPLPEDIYGITKAAMEQVTKVMSSVYGFKYLIFRPHNVYGPRQNLSDPYRNVIGIFINRLLQNKNFYIYGNGEQRRAFSYIDDIIYVIAKTAFEGKVENEIFNIGSDEVVTLNQLSKIILKEFFNSKVPKDLKPKYLPKRPQEVKDAFCDHTKAKKLLRYKARTRLHDGIKRTIEWAKSLGPQKFMYLDSFELDHKNIPKTWIDKLY